MPLEGERLHRYLARFGQLEVEQALDIAIDIAKTIAARHDLGEVHGRLEPRLVLFREGRAVVTGWSIASKIRERYRQGSVLLKDVLLGNPKYLSPEAIKDPWSFQPSGINTALAASCSRCWSAGHRSPVGVWILFYSGMSNLCVSVLCDRMQVTALRLQFSRY